MAENLVAGEVVVLRSGGPRMTVEEVAYDNGDILITCSWFDENNRRQREQFLSKMLDRA
ncbi:MAG: DUF2158 domain-containing protein [Alphaproteobacteria bacterium]|nr:DUF2158 domain-containing protein [Alphaproteobacteria bacterium]